MLINYLHGTVPYLYIGNTPFSISLYIIRLDEIYIVNIQIGICIKNKTDSINIL